MDSFKFTVTGSDLQTGDVRDVLDYVIDNRLNHADHQLNIVPKNFEYVINIGGASITTSSGVTASVTIASRDGERETIRKTKKRRLDNTVDIENIKKVKLAGECSICLENLSFIDPSPDKEVMSTQCGHLFCKCCIEPVLKKNKQCPKCRREQRVRDLHALYL